jgi:CubicO group peptidase (beta-lactamase class C family)
MRRCVPRATVAWLPLALLIAASPQAAAAEELSRLLEDLEAMRVEMDVPALALTLADNEGTIWAGAMGVADRASGRPADATTMFRIGSVTKLFTALALLIAEEDKVLALDMPLREVVPAAPFENRWEATHPLRIVHLLEHTAGLPDLSREEFDVQAPMPLREALAWKAADRRTLWPPGLHHSYTNAGAGLAALALETATGTAYENFVAQRIFAPLGMHSAGFRPDPETLAALATGYDTDGKTPIPYWHMLYRAFGAINLRPAEIGPLLALLLSRGTYHGQRLLDETSVVRMEQPRTTLAARAGLKYGYGLGNYTWLHRGLLFHGHGGDGDGYLARLGYSPAARRGYFIVINVFRNADLRRLQRRVEDYIAGNASNPEPPPFNVPAEALSGIAGDYEAAAWRFAPPGDVALRIEIERGGIFVRRGNTRRRLIPVSEALFRYERETLATCAIVSHDGRTYFQDEDGSYVRVRDTAASIEWGPRHQDDR